MQFGPLKPVGIGRPENRQASLCGRAIADRASSTAPATTWSDFRRLADLPGTKRVFRLIPGLEQASFAVRQSASEHVHQFSPIVEGDLEVEEPRHRVFRRTIGGVEGYTESAAMGGIAGINAARGLAGQPLVTPPSTSAHGCLIAHLTKSDPAHFQPMNTNFGLFPPVSVKTRDKDQKRRLIQQRAVEDFDAWIAQSGISYRRPAGAGRRISSDRSCVCFRSGSRFQAFAGTVLNARGVLP